MNAIGKLIKAKTIPFVDTLLHQYRKIGLTEVEAMMLVQLYYYQEEKNNFLVLNDLQSRMSLTVQEVSDVFMQLVSKGYVDLHIDDNGDAFCLDMIYDQLGKVLEEPEQSNSFPESDILLQEMAQFIEKTFERPISASDLDILSEWVDKYNLEQMKDAVLQASKMKVKNLKYADAIIVSKNKKREEASTDDIDDEIIDLLGGIYVKQR